MDEKRRMLIMMVADDRHDAFPLIHQFESFRRRDEMYSWFIKNKLTGKKFIEFCKQFEFGKISIAKFVLSKIDKWKKEEIQIGRDLV